MVNVFCGSACVGFGVSHAHRPADFARPSWQPFRSVKSLLNPKPVKHPVSISSQLDQDAPALGFSPKQDPTATLAFLGLPFSVIAFAPAPMVQD